MSDQAFQRRTRELVGMTVERELGSAGLDAIVELGRGPMVVDVLHCLGSDACFIDSHTDRAGRLFAALFEADAMVCLASGSVSHNLAVDMRASSESVLQLFE